MIRRLVGYGRYDTQAQVDQLNRLYVQYRVFVNFFLPVMKLQEKVRGGSRVQKKYDAPQTPYVRLLASPEVSHAVKAKPRAAYTQLAVVTLKQAIDRLLDALKPSSVR